LLVGESSRGHVGHPQPTVILTNAIANRIFIGIHCRQGLAEFPSRSEYASGARQAG